MSRKLKIAALQRRIGGYVAPAEFKRLREQGVDLVCLPEYLFIPAGVRNQIETAHQRQTILGQLETYSSQLVGIVVGGTLVEEEEGRFYNACHVFNCGRHVGSYRKRKLTGRERAAGISPGCEPAVFEVRGFRLGLLICADVLFPENYREMIGPRPEVISVPTVSPLLENDTVEDKYRRDESYFVAGAKDAGAYVLKACGVGTIMGSKLQGRSLICSPDGILARVSPRNEHLEATLIAEVDLDQLPTPIAPGEETVAPEFLLPPGLTKA